MNKSIQTELRHLYDVIATTPCSGTSPLAGEEFIRLCEGKARDLTRHRSVFEDSDDGLFCVKPSFVGFIWSSKVESSGDLIVEFDTWKDRVSDSGEQPMTPRHGGSADTIIKDLMDLEPIFHTRSFGTTLHDFEERMVEDYWEIGASGRRWSRAEILEVLAGRPLIWADQSGWRCSEHAVIDLGGDVHLFTYRLDQGKRSSRRATIWRRKGGFWQILYHQGTLLTEQTALGERLTTRSR